MSTDPSSPPDGGQRKRIIAIVIGALLLLITAIVAPGTLIVALQHSRANARRLECCRNMRELGIHYHNFHDTMGSFPTENAPENARDNPTIYLDILDFM
jgi:hypothetical protein